MTNITSSNTLNSGKTVKDILTIVNYAINQKRSAWHLTPFEIQDLQQDGYVAAIRADSVYDPRRSSWAGWVLRRVYGQLHTSIARLRNSGITGIYHTKKADFSNPVPLVTEHNGDDEALDGWETEELIAPGPDTSESADVAGQMAVLQSCVSERSKRILSLYYGLEPDSKAMSTTELAKAIGHSRKHAFTLLQVAQAEARLCLGSDRTRPAGE